MAETYVVSGILVTGCLLYVLFEFYTSGGNLLQSDRPPFLHTPSIGNTTHEPEDANLHFNRGCFSSGKQHFTTSSEDADFEFLKTEEGKKYKTILLYHYTFGIRNIGFGYGPKAFDGACCKEKRCFMTNKTDKISVENFDAVLIQFYNVSFTKLPKRRKQNQRWIFYNIESPIYSQKNTFHYGGIFNWTMTYRRDSDIFSGYGRFYPRSLFPVMKFNDTHSKSLPLKVVMKTKTSMAAWMVSHCETSSGREDFVKDLQKYVNVSIYGECGDMGECGMWDVKELTDYCYKLFEKKYKFYLSFENSLCNDYVTEKFFNLLRFNIVPVVRGFGDYSTIAPPYSYIDVRDFKSVEKLADYLKYLDSNDTAYMEYFRWKVEFFVTDDPTTTHVFESFCQLCEKLHEDKEEKVYNDLKGWFWDKAECKGVPLATRLKKNFHANFKKRKILYGNLSKVGPKNLQVKLAKV